MHLSGMRVLEKPRAVQLLFGAEQFDRFTRPRVRHVPNRSEVFEGTQHVVVPADWKRELQPGGVHDLAGALASEQISFEQVLLTPASSVDGLRRTTGCAFVRQQPFQDVNRGRERRAHGTVLRFAIPAAILELLAKQAVDDAVYIL